MQFNKKIIRFVPALIYFGIIWYMSTKQVPIDISKSDKLIHVVEYARSKNYDELICAQLSDSNIYYGINDYATTLIHAYVQVFDIDDSILGKKFI